MHKFISVLLGLLGLAVANAGCSHAPLAAQTSYQFLREIPIGGTGGWDYVSTDSVARKLYLAHATQIVVVNLDENKITGTIDNTPGVHGLAIAPELSRGFSSNGKENKVSIVDLATLKTLSKVKVGENPDAIVYESKRQEVYAFNGKSNSVTILGARSGKVVRTTALPGKPEFAVADSERSQVFVNIEDKHEVVSISTDTHKITAHFPIAPGETPTGIALDSARGLLFIGCENQKMILINATSGKVLDSIPIGNGVDATAFDPETKLAFSSNGEGSLTIARVDSNDKLMLIQVLKTERGARTLALDLKTHRIYLPTAQFVPQAKDAQGHPKIIDGTQKLLVYELTP